MEKSRRSLLDERMEQAKTAVETRLNDFWREQRETQEQSFEHSTEIDRFYKALAFACAGGKRIRAFLVAEGAYLVDGELLTEREKKALIETMMAIEMVHAYSLVHDDLPAMDNDLLRRGKPTLHVAFDEATAILTGDALLTTVFELLAGLPLEPVKIKDIVTLFARSCGARGMVAGQVMDMGAGTPAKGGLPAMTLQTLKIAQSLKTGELMACALESGAIIADAKPRDRTTMRKAGLALGKLFQIVDDILDVEGDENLTGKKTGRDKNKITWYHFMPAAEVKAQVDLVCQEIQRIAAMLTSQRRDDLLVLAGKLRTRKG